MKGWRVLGLALRSAPGPVLEPARSVSDSPTGVSDTFRISALLPTDNVPHPHLPASVIADGTRARIGV
ncbi:hypothetical protein CAL18_02730 [Bordetella genomosp. 7]|nr:hypothetical protein CAL18_02730 [Bordetella genomosp. 7]